MTKYPLARVLPSGSATTKMMWISGLALSLMIAAASSRGLGAQPGSETTARPPAPVSATLGHEPFPLVTADPVGDVRIPLVELSDRLVHHYTFLVEERAVEFFAVWSGDNVIRTAFNACDICYRAKLGYRHDGVWVVCNNCGNRFAIPDIARVVGGCNPAPLVARIDGEDLVITAAALAAGQSYFP